jgi:hypothetical protein
VIAYEDAAPCLGVSIVFNVSLIAIWWSVSLLLGVYLSNIVGPLRGLKIRGLRYPYLAMVDGRNQTEVVRCRVRGSKERGGGKGQARRASQEALALTIFVTSARVLLAT